MGRKSGTFPSSHTQRDTAAPFEIADGVVRWAERQISRP